MKRITIITIVAIFWLLSGCDFQNPSDFEIPKWNINLNIPLMDQSYALAEIVNDSTIHSAGDSIQVQFSGELPKDSVNADYLKIPIDIHPDPFVTTIYAPSSADIFTGYDFSSSDIIESEFIDSDTIRIGVMMESLGVINWAAFPPDTVQFPSDTLQKIDSTSWNAVANVIEGLFGGTEVEETLFDSDQLFSSVPFISELLGIIIGDSKSDSDISTFQSIFENVDMPMNIESSWAMLISGVDTLAHHDTTNLAAGEDQDTTTYLKGKTLGNAIGLNFGFTLQRATADVDTIIIPASSEVKMVFGIGMGIQDLDSAQVVVDSVSLMDAGDMDPISFEDASVSAEDCAVTGIYGGDFALNTDEFPKTNYIGISNVFSTFPFGINFGIEFENFIYISGEDTTTLKFQHSLTSKTYSDEKKLDGWLFRNPNDPDPKNPTIPLDSLIITPIVTTLPGTVSVALDGSPWDFSLGVEVWPLEFSSLKADLDCTFPPQTQEIAGIPTGFTGMSFGEVILEFTMFNQIKLPLFLDLDLKGVGKMGDTETVIIKAELGIPDSPGDTAKTVLRLNKDGIKVDLYKIASSTTPDSSYFLPKTDTTGTIVDLLALNPTEIIVDAVADVKGMGSIEQNAAFWGEYELIAPFAVTMEPMTFIPNTSTPMDEMPHDTRSQMRNSMKGAIMTTRIINGLPVGGELSILLSDKDLFPLDREDSTLTMVRDSLGWPGTDILYIVSSCSTLTPSNPNMYIFSVMTDSTDCVEDVAYLIRDAASSEVDTVISFVDTLFKVVLPSPAAFYTSADPGFTPGMVKDRGDTTVVSGLDSNDVNLLTSLGDHFITSRIHFFGTDDNVVFFSMRDTLRALAYLTFTMVSTGLFEEVKDEIIITNPNGGETFTIDEDVIIRWRSLGNKVKSGNIEVFTSLVPDPDVTNDDHWVAITSAPVANDDSLLWTPNTPAEALWLRVCNEAGNLCDQSGWTFEVVSGTRTLGVRHWGEDARKFNEPPNVHQHTVEEKLDNKFHKRRK